MTYEEAMAQSTGAGAPFEILVEDVAGLPMRNWKNREKAVVRLSPGQSIDENEVRRHVAAHMAAFKLLEFVEFIAEPLPRNPAGRILKNVLRGEGEVSFAPDSLAP